jgi:hypothetical protein
LQGRFGVEVFGSLLGKRNGFLGIVLSMTMQIGLILCVQ